MHLAVLYQYYHNPDCAASARHYALLDCWAQRHDVTLITSNQWRAQRLSERFPWVPPGVRLVELDVQYSNRMPPLQRAMAFARYAARALGAARRLPRPDLLFGTSTPLSAAWTAARIARARQVPWVFEVRDLWPDFPIEMQAVPRLLHAQARRTEARLYGSAGHVIAFSPEMEAHVRHVAPAARTTLLYNGTDLPLVEAAAGADLDALRAAHGLAGKRVLLYAGAFGRANAIPFMLDAARALAHRDDHVFVFMGDGFHRDTIAEAAAALPNVRLVPPQPHHAIFPWFRLADLSLVSFIDLPVLGTNSPSKLYDSLASGTPVLVTNAGWMRDLVEKEGCGWYAPSSDVAAYAAAVAALLDAPEGLAEAGRRAGALPTQPGYRLMFSRQLQAARYLDIFEEVAARPVPAP